MATPVPQLEILGDRMIENVYFTYFAWWAMVSLWLRFCFLRAGRRRISCAGLAMKAGHSGWGANAMLRTWWAGAGGVALEPRDVCGYEVSCFCYLGLSWA